MRALALAAALLGAAAHAQPVAPRLGAVEASGFVMPARPPVPDDVEVTISLSTYPVTGATDEAVVAAIEAASPFRNADGSKRSDAYTAWRIRWSPTYAVVPGGCRVTDFRVTLGLETTIYALDPPPGAPAAFVARWAHRHAVLLRHEEGHQTLAVLAALDLADRIRGTTGRSCPEAAAVANAEGQAVLTRLREVNVAYDEATARGTRPAPGLR